MTKVFLIILLAWVPGVYAADAEKEAELNGRTVAIVTECEWDARLSLFECRQSPASRTECFLEVMNRYDNCCTEHKVACPDLTF